ncbi:MAG TPA: YCF48-related protein [Streptosporangiaceae bacterium]
MSLLIAGCGSRPTAGAGHPSSPAAATASQTASTSPAAASSPGGATAPATRSPGACGVPSPAAPGARNELGGVQFVSGSTGWVVGPDRILGTDDGGRHWLTEYRTTARARLSSVDFVDSSHGWVVGASTILATADSGEKWRQLPEPCPLLRTVHFISPAVGFAVAGGQVAGGPVSGGVVSGGTPVVGGVLLTTTDGGQHWRRLPAPPNVQTVCFAAPGSGWLGADGRIYGTADGGRTWTLAVRGVRAPVNMPGLAAVECAGPSAAWAELLGPDAAMSQQPHVGYHASGRAWRPIFAEQYFPHPGVPVSAQSPGSYSGPFSAVSPADAMFIDFCPSCGNGTAPMGIARKGGALLQARGHVGGLTQADAAAFVTVDDGWVVGSHATYQPPNGPVAVVNRIVHTTDGGRTWQVQYSAP